MTHLTLRLAFSGGAKLGPGKVRLLELIDETGSISAAARAMGMSYRRAWLLVDSLNHGFHEPAVATRLGGHYGGGARLTPLGRRLVSAYHRMEQASREACAEEIAAIEAELAEPPA